MISSTLERGFGAGLRVALAPALTDGPIIAISLMALQDLPTRWLTAITLLGGLFVVWIGIQTVRSARREVESEAQGASSAHDLRRGMLVNVLNPHPWLFWLTVGGPILITAWQDAPILAFGFVAIFYILIVGAKVVLAWTTARGRRFLTGTGYRRLLAASGLVLIGMGSLLVWQGALGGS